jgi:hypothetical protein
MNAQGVLITLSAELVKGEKEKQGKHSGVRIQYPEIELMTED